MLHARLPWRWHCSFFPRRAQLTRTPHTQSELGDVVYVELPAVGSALTAGKTFGVVESVKVRTGWGAWPHARGWRHSPWCASCLPHPPGRL